MGYSSLAFTVGYLSGLEIPSPRLEDITWLLLPFKN